MTDPTEPRPSPDPLRLTTTQRDVLDALPADAADVVLEPRASGTRAARESVAATLAQRAADVLPPMSEKAALLEAQDREADGRDVAPSIDEIERVIRNAASGPQETVALVASAVARLYAPTVAALRTLERRQDGAIERLKADVAELQRAPFRLRAVDLVRRLLPHLEHVQTDARRSEVALCPAELDALIVEARLVAAEPATVAPHRCASDAALRALLAEIEAPGSTGIAVVAEPGSITDGVPRIVSGESLLEYLDGGIAFWRERRDVPGASPVDRLVARCYVDALQCARVAFFGSTLPTLVRGPAARQPRDGETVSVEGTTFVFVSGGTPKDLYRVPIGATIEETAESINAAVERLGLGKIASLSPDGCLTIASAPEGSTR